MGDTLFDFLVTVDAAPPAEELIRKAVACFEHNSVRSLPCVGSAVAALAFVSTAVPC